MSADRELLELAAKATGMDVEPFTNGLLYFWHRRGPQDSVAWNPLTDDGDALRLAVRLRLEPRVVNISGLEQVEVHGPFDGFFTEDVEGHGNDYYAATRRAIVRAAAEVGKGMRPFPSDEEIRENWT